MPHFGSARLARAVLLAAAALALPATALAAREERAVSGPPTTPHVAGAVPGHVIVVWKPGTAPAERLAARDGAGAGFVRTLGDPRFQLLRPEPGRSTADAIAALRADPAVQTVARDTYDVPLATSNDPLLNQQWGLQNLGLGIDGFAGAVAGADVNALAAWDRTRGTSSTTIADIDSGYRFDAPDLGPVAWTNPGDPPNGVDDDHDGIVDDTHGADFVGGEADAPTTDGDPTDDDLIDGGHGVHTAGTMGAAGNNGVGVSGVAQDVRIMPLRVCAFSSTFGETRCPSSAQIAAINYAGAHGARAANMSLGGTTFNPAVLAALAANPGVLFAIAAGNDGQDNDVVPHYPCAYDPSTTGIPGAVDNVICVAATDQADGLASFSDWGARSVDVGAPGTEILSTYPASDTDFSEGFETNDFATRWTNGGAGFGRAAAGDGPLTSFGMTDSPAAAPAAGSFHQVTLTTAFAVPAGSGACQLSGRRFLSMGADGAFSYYVIPSAGGTAEFDVGSDTAGSSMAPFVTVPIVGLAGTTVRVRFEYSAPSAPTAGDGVWLDDLELTCNAPLSTPPTYGFLDGTSMATPHVTGAAGLLFSLDPSATVAQVRAALIATVRPDPALAGKTTGGGRVDAAAALDEIRQPDTAVTAGPRRSTRSTRATFTFVRSDAPLAGPFQCQLDGHPFATCSSPATFRVRGGRHTFAVRALSPRAIVADPTPATYRWTVLQCKVPKLRGLALARARRALSKAHCKLGKVTRPRRAHGKLVVVASRPKAGAVRANGAKVRVALGRPKPRRRRGGRR